MAAAAASSSAPSRHAPVLGGAVRWWSPHTHRSFSHSARRRASLLLRIAHRIANQQRTGPHTSKESGTSDSTRSEAGPAETTLGHGVPLYVGLPPLPSELWEMILSLLAVVPTRFTVDTIAGTPNTGLLRNGPVHDAAFFVPTGLAVGLGGEIYVADSNNHAIRTIAADRQTVSTLAGPSGHLEEHAGIHWGFVDGPVSEARFQHPMDVAVAHDGTVLVSDHENHAVRAITDGMVQTLRASECVRESDDHHYHHHQHHPYDMHLYRPMGITVTPSGDVLICDTFHHRIAKLCRATGEVSTVAQAERWADDVSFGMPTAVGVLPTGHFVTSAAPTNRLWEITHTDSASFITKVAGDGNGLVNDAPRHFLDGPGDVAKFWHPRGLCVDGAGNVIVADTNNNCIRLVEPRRHWLCTKIAGTVERGYRDGPAEHAQFFRPVAVALDNDGSVLVADTDNHVIRRVRCCEYDFVP
eukprot:m.205222 g.205222  ORF g.205222 m.205222 type:complete len:469 (+) comp22868_c0_seq1:53-1459(+)